ncbi:MAG: patatin-like phospholipase family protein [Actinomycetota bacterium]|nr:patatin-like phospholipase family protein [Actinomycetota bacterium]
MRLFGPRKLGLALGSGSARGLAHIGVLKVLEAEGLAPDVIAGTSMGAVVGAFYAAGVPLAEIEAVALDFDVTDIARVGDLAFSKGAVFSGQKAQEFLRKHLPESFDDLRIPFGCVATDMTRNRPVRFTSGDLIAAVRASASVPVAFLPVRMDDMILIDGYVSEPVPVSLARHLGGQTIVAVDVSGTGTVALPGEGSAPGAFKLKELHAVMVDGAARDRGDSGIDILGAVSEAFEARVAEPALREADVLISPEVHYFSALSYGRAADAIAAGEAAAVSAVARIRRKARRSRR